MNKFGFGKATIPEKMITASLFLALGLPAAIYLDSVLLAAIVSLMGVIAIHAGYWQLRTRTANTGGPDQ